MSACVRWIQLLRLAASEARSLRSTRSTPGALRVQGFGTSIFTEMTLLARECGAINLAQGFPDFDGPLEVQAAALEALRSGDNQYAVSHGQLDLRTAVAEHALRFYGQQVDGNSEVTVTSGATEAIFAALQALVDPGDEVIVFEPFYDSYVPSVVMAGGVARSVALRPPAWNFDPQELAQAFNTRTRAILINTPHNPTGKVFSQAELGCIAALCIEWNVLALVDEVYEHLTYDGVAHVRLAQLAGMRERTLTISSAGKTFSYTGWKIGWVIAPPALTAAVRSAHQFITFSTATPLQHAAAAGLRLPDSYFSTLAHEYFEKRNFLAGVLQRAGLGVLDCAGTYFLMADIAARGFADDVEFCRFLTRNVGVAAVPPSAFFSDANKALGKRYARFSFCKKMATLQLAAERLEQPWKP